MSDTDLIRRRAVLDAVGALYVLPKYPQDRQNNATVEAAIDRLIALPPDPVAAAALALMECLLERDDRNQYPAVGPKEWGEWIEDRGGWAARVGGLLAACRKAKEAAK